MWCENKCKRTANGVAQAIGVDKSLPIRWFLCAAAARWVSRGRRVRTPGSVKTDARVSGLRNRGAGEQGSEGSKLCSAVPAPALLLPCSCCPALAPPQLARVGDAEVAAAESVLPELHMQHAFAQPRTTGGALDDAAGFAQQRHEEVVLEAVERLRAREMEIVGVEVGGRLRRRRELVRRLRTSRPGARLPGSRRCGSGWRRVASRSRARGRCRASRSARSARCASALSPTIGARRVCAANCRRKCVGQRVGMSSRALAQRRQVDADRR